jgi:fructose transport system substrate-binding protein
MPKKRVAILISGRGSNMVALIDAVKAKDFPAEIALVVSNEPAAEGAFQAMKAAGKETQALIVSVDGGCPGVQNVKAGVIGATSMQFPLLMASKGVEAVAAFAKDGTKPTNSEGLDFFNTGVQLITDKPVDGLPSITSEEGLKICWG